MSPELSPTGDTDNDSFAVQLPAVPEHVGTTRHKFAQWLSDIQVPRDRLYDILLGVGEAVANAMEHGGRFDAAQLVSVTASVRDEILTVTVSDRGCWIDPSKAPTLGSRHRGRGFLLINALANKVDIHRSAEGTRIVMQFDVSEQAAPRLTGSG